MNKTYYIVVGRVMYDDDDSSNAFLASDFTEALGLWEAWMVKERGKGDIIEQTGNEDPDEWFIVTACWATNSTVEPEAINV